MDRILFERITAALTARSVTIKYCRLKIHDMARQWRRFVRILVVTVLLSLAPCVVLAQSGATSFHNLANAPETIVVRLSNFAFEPAHLRLRVGVPVRLRLVNSSGGAHNFSAPAFFSASATLPGSMLPVNGKIDVPGKGTAEIWLEPRRPGTYPIECTHFLHSFFGMRGTIEVVAPFP